MAIIGLVDKIVQAVEKMRVLLVYFKIFQKLSTQLIMKFCCINRKIMVSEVL